MFLSVKDMICNFIYSFASSVGNFIVPYITFAIITAAINYVVSVLKKQSDHICKKITPAVRAIQDSEIEQENKDLMLANLYKINNYNALPIYIITIINIIINILIYSSLFIIDGTNTSVNTSFLGVENITQPQFCLPLVIFYCLLINIIPIVKSIIEKKIDKKTIMFSFLSLVLTFLSMFILTKMFPPLILIYLSTKSISNFVLYLTKPLKRFSKEQEVIIPPEIAALIPISEGSDTNAINA